MKASRKENSQNAYKNLWVVMLTSKNTTFRLAYRSCLSIPSNLWGNCT